MKQHNLFHRIASVSHELTLTIIIPLLIDQICKHIYYFGLLVNQQ